MASHRALPDEVDLDACAREPIRTLGTIQPHGTLLVLSPDDLIVLQAALGSRRVLNSERPQGRPLATVLPAFLQSLPDHLAARLPLDEPLYLGSFQDGGAEGGFHAIAHPSDDAIILELEEAEAGEPGAFEDVYPLVSALIAELQQATSIDQLGAAAAREIRRLTRFDRVLVYRFDEDWNGTVIAEDGNGVLPSYLHLRFPAADIPAQARELYRLNRLRLIASADYQPVPIEPAAHPQTSQATDLSFAVLRSVSPIHLEYMRNMGTGASMSISLLRDGALWGLISCHNAEPRRVPYHIRTACDLLGQILSLQFAARELAVQADRRIALRSVQTRLLARMAAEESFVAGLVAGQEDLLGLTHASGAAIVSEGLCELIGETPDEETVHSIVDWLGSHPAEDVLAFDSMAAVMPGAEAFKDEASGLLAISISQVHASYLLWFRPEVIRTISWGGSPVKAVEASPHDGRIHPRKSFDVWKESVRLRAMPWDPSEIEAAGQLRNAIVDIVLRKAEEMAALSEQLIRSNKELEAFSYSVSHDLRAPFRHIVGYSELLKRHEGEVLSERGRRYIETIIESALSAGTLVDDLLSFSQMGRATLHPISLDMNRLVEEVRQQLKMTAGDRPIEWRIAELPPALGDPTMLRLVIQNLLENALKFTRGRDPAVIEVGALSKGAETVYFVRDNGVGFDMRYAAKLFGVFQRLHRVEEFEGTGIGLANVKRIVEHRHGGRVWAESEVDGGATFFFALPPEGAQ